MSNNSQVYITHVVDPFSFHAVFGNDETLQKFHAFEEKLDKLCAEKLSKLPPSSEIEDGICVLAFSESADKWCRGLVTQSVDMEADVLFSDYGFSELVAKDKIITQIPQEISVVSIPAFSCQLTKVQPLASTWIRKVSEYFKSLILKKTLNAVIYDVTPMTQVCLELYIESDGSKNPVSVMMIENGFAMPSQKETSEPSGASVIPALDFTSLNKCRISISSDENGDFEKELFLQGMIPNGPTSAYAESDLQIVNLTTPDLEERKSVPDMLSDIKRMTSDTYDYEDRKNKDGRLPEPLVVDSPVKSRRGRGRGRSYPPKSHSMSPKPGKKGSPKGQSKKPLNSSPKSSAPSQQPLPNILTPQQKNDEYEWRKDRLQVKFKLILAKKTATEEESIDKEFQLMLLIFPDKSSLAELPGERELYIAVETMVELSVEQAGSYRRSCLDILTKLSPTENFTTQVGKVLTKLQQKYIEAGKQKHQVKTRQSFISFVGDLYHCSKEWESNELLVAFVTSTVEKWAIFNRQGTNPNMETTELFTECLGYMIQSLGDDARTVIPSETMAEVRKKAAIKKFPSDLREQFMAVYSIYTKQEELLEPEVAAKPVEKLSLKELTASLPPFERAVPKRFVERLVVVEPTPEPILVDCATQTIEVAHHKDTPSDDDDEYKVVKHMLRSLNLMHTWPTFEDNAIRDSTLELNNDDLKELLLECGIKRGQWLEIKNYMRQPRSVSPSGSNASSLTQQEVPGEIFEEKEMPLMLPHDFQLTSSRSDMQHFSSEYGAPCSELTISANQFVPANREWFSTNKSPNNSSDKSFLNGQGDFDYPLPLPLRQGPAHGIVFRNGVQSLTNATFGNASSVCAICKSTFHATNNCGEVPK